MKDGAPHALNQNEKLPRKVSLREQCLSVMEFCLFELYFIHLFSLCCFSGNFILYVAPSVNVLSLHLSLLLLSDLIKPNV